MSLTRKLVLRAVIDPALNVARAARGSAGRLVLPALLAGVLGACAAAPTLPAPKTIAKVERVDGHIGRITLDAKAAQRIGIQTAKVAAAGGDRVIPYGALIYDVKGDAYTYVNSQALVYERLSVRVKSIRGDQVILADGPAAGTTVVTVGAAQLLGIELGIGS